MSKLAPDLDTALQQWRVRWQAGEQSKKPRRVAVAVIHTGDVAPLQEAGLEGTFAGRGELSGMIAFRDLERLAALPTVVYIEMQPRARPLLDTTITEMRVPWKVPPSTPWPGRGAGVIVAVIDTGIDIFHESFRKTDGKTRILELWDQAASTGGAAPPPQFPSIGRVYSAKDINDGLAAGPPFHSVDKNGHGTHVAGIAAGNGRQDDRCSSPGHYVGVAPEADLVIVKAIALPDDGESDTRAAMRWCRGAAQRLNTPGKPIVINCSFGSSTGAHDGNDYNDRSVDMLLEPLLPSDPPPKGLAIVCAAGNDGNSDIREGGTIPANGSKIVLFYVPDGSRDSDTLDIWYNGTATLTLTLTAPPNPAQPPPNIIGPIAPGAAGSPFTIGGMSIRVSSSTAPIPLHDNRKQINVNIGFKATTQLDGAIAAADTSIKVDSASGFPLQGEYKVTIGDEVLNVTAGQGATTWTVTRGVDGKTAAAHRDDAEVQLAYLIVRSGVWQMKLDETSGVAADWQAWFASSSLDPFPTFRLPKTPSAERRCENVIDSPGSSRKAITVANYSDDDGHIAASSSRGVNPISAGTPVHEVKPTIAAPGQGVYAARSRDDKDERSSCCDQLVVEKSGTSMAAPHVTGLVALMFEKNPTLTFEDVRKHLQSSTLVDGIPAAEVPPVFNAALNIRANHIWGSGKVNAAAALTATPSAPASGGGGGGGGGGPGAPRLFVMNESEFGYTPHTIFSRLGDWRTRFGPRPGLMLVAALISEHFDEVLRLVRHNPRVGAVWRRQGGPILVRRLLYDHSVQATLLPAAVEGCDVRRLVRRFLPVLMRFGSTRLRLAVDRYAGFVETWPGAALQRLDEQALELAARR